MIAPRYIQDHATHVELIWLEAADGDWIRFRPVMYRQRDPDSGRRIFLELFAAEPALSGLLRGPSGGLRHDRLGGSTILRTVRRGEGSDGSQCTALAVDISPGGVFQAGRRFEAGA